MNQYTIDRKKKAARVAKFAEAIGALNDLPDARYGGVKESDNVSDAERQVLYGMHSARKRLSDACIALARDMVRVAAGLEEHCATWSVNSCGEAQGAITVNNLSAEFAAYRRMVDAFPRDQDNLQCANARCTNPTESGKTYCGSTACPGVVAK